MWRTAATLELEYRNTDDIANGTHPAYGFMIHGKKFIHPDFNPSGVVEACVVVDGPQGLEILASIWNNDQDCYDTVEVKLHEIDLWCRKPDPTHTTIGMVR